MFGYKILWNVSRTNLQRLRIRKISQEDLALPSAILISKQRAHIWISALKDTATRTHTGNFGEQKKMCVTYKESISY